VRGHGITHLGKHTEELQGQLYRLRTQPGRDPRQEAGSEEGTATIVTTVGDYEAPRLQLPSDSEGTVDGQLAASVALLVL
jgi:hypothetical protein